MDDDDFDTPWKEVVIHHFPEFMAFYFPLAHAAIDWSRPHAFLDQEFGALTRDAELGKRLLDKLVSVYLHDGSEQWVLVHMEVQGWRDARFAERMFVYNYRVYDRYQRPVASLALLADDAQRDWGKQRIINLYRIIDWIMRLPEGLEARLRYGMLQIERRKAMTYLSSIERIGMEIGRREGRQEARAEVLTELLILRFGPLDALLRVRIAEADVPQLSAWTRNVINATSLDEVFRNR